MNGEERRRRRDNVALDTQCVALIKRCEELHLGLKRLTEDESTEPVFLSLARYDDINARYDDINGAQRYRYRVRWGGSQGGHRRDRVSDVPVAAYQLGGVAPTYQALIGRHRCFAAQSGAMVASAHVASDHRRRHGSRRCGRPPRLLGGEPCQNLEPSDRARVAENDIKPCDRRRDRGISGLSRARESVSTGWVARRVAITALSEISDALYPSRAGTAQNPFPEYTQMVNERTALVTAITTVANYAAPTANESVGTHGPGFRPGGESRERSTERARGERKHEPADWCVQRPRPPGGLATVPNVFAGPIANVPKMPWAWNVPNQLGRTWSAGGNTPPLASGSTFYALEEMANAIVYRFMSVAYLYLGHDITLARNDDPHNLIPNYPLGAPLTSSPLPPGAGNQPLLAFNPAGGNLPYRFG